MFPTVIKPIVYCLILTCPLKSIPLPLNVPRFFLLVLGLVLGVPVPSKSDGGCINRTSYRRESVIICGTKLVQHNPSKICIF